MRGNGIRIWKRLRGRRMCWGRLRRGKRRRCGEQAKSRKAETQRTGRSEEKDKPKTHPYKPGWGTLRILKIQESRMIDTTLMDLPRKRSLTDADEYRDRLDTGG